VNIENDIFDPEEVIKEAEELAARSSRGDRSALDSYFARLGNCPQIAPKRQIELATEYHGEIQACQDILDKIPGKVRFLTRVLEQILQGERLPCFFQMDKEARRFEFFKELEAKASLKNPCLRDWSIRPNLLLNWSRELVQMHQEMPQRPWISRITQMNQQHLSDLHQWLDAMLHLEQSTLLPINQLAYYANELRPRAQKAETLFDTLVECNLKLVVAIARRYQNRGLALDDLIQEGNLGLIKGLEKFQPAKGFNVSTYVVWWIRQSVTRALATQGTIIRYPPGTYNLLRKISKLQDEAMQAGLPDPTYGALAQQLGTSLENIEAALAIYQITSLNQSVGDSEETTLEQAIVGEEGLTLDESEALREAIENLLSTLKPQERSVLRLRFGLTAGCNETVNEIAATLKVSRERIRQIEAKALAKLRASRAVQTQKSRFFPS